MHDAVIQSALKADIPLMLWGAPGTGKTAKIQQLAKQANADLITLIGSTIDPVDVGGLPVPYEGVLKISPPQWALKAKKSKKAWIFFDEMSCAPPSVQAALLRVVHERRVADLDLKGCRMLAACNPVESAADGGSIAAATANRWAHIEWDVEPNAWIVGCRSNWGDAWGEVFISSVTSITGFIQKKPDALIKDPDVDCKAYATPRSWVAAIRMLASSGGPSSSNALSLVASNVGEAAALEWHEWFRLSDLPDPEDLLSGSVELPKRGDRLLAALGGLVAAASINRPDRESRINKAWDILSYCRPDITLSAAQSLLKSDPDCTHASAVALGEKICDVSKT